MKHLILKSKKRRPFIASWLGDVDEFKRGEVEQKNDTKSSWFQNDN